MCGVGGFEQALGRSGLEGVVPHALSRGTRGRLASDVTAAARAFTVMAGEAESLDGVQRPRLAVPRGWVTDLDEPTANAWRAVAKGIPDVDFVEHSALFRIGLTIPLVEAATYHRRWVADCPEKYGADVLAHLERGLAVLGVDLTEAVRERAALRAAADAAMDGIDALVLPATAIVAPPVEAGTEVREPLTRFTRPFNTTGQPAVSVPARVKGLPVGVQVVGRTNEGTLRAALWLERSWAEVR